MEKKVVRYSAGEIHCNGYLVYNEIVQETRPGILLVHAWRGQDEFIKEKAEAIANLGYVAFAVDMYGEGKRAENDEDAAALMKPLFINRKEVRERINAALDAFKKQDRVNPKKIGAIGYCFGGMVVIELLRSGAGIKAGVSIHGIIGPKKGEDVAQLVPNEKIQGALQVLNGYEDPMVSQEDIVNIEKEFNDAGVPWQVVNFGHATHAFTNPQAKNKEKGMAYNKEVSDSAWKSMRGFLEEKMR